MIAKYASDGDEDDEEDDGREDRKDADTVFRNFYNYQKFKTKGTLPNTQEHQVRERSGFLERR